MISEKTNITKAPEVIVSLHDVMPETMQRVEEILAFCQQTSIPPFTLLVVPGKDWSAKHMERMHEFADMGYQFAAHGWQHRFDEYGGIYHRVHGAVLSRRSAEHLAHKQDEIMRLMQRSYDWFQSHNLPSPTLYVPPAWAVGNIARSKLALTPFDQIETLHGVFNIKSNRFHALPLVGYEADTLVRALFLRAWNTGQWMLARSVHRPLRIGIHPDDLHLKLKRTLSRLMQRPLQFRSYQDVG